MTGLRPDDFRRAEEIIVKHVGNPTAHPLLRRDIAFAISEARDRGESHAAALASMGLSAEKQDID